MSPVPKKPQKPMDASNARGILLSSTTGKVYAKLLRHLTVPCIQRAAHPTQLGGFPGQMLETAIHTAFQRATHFKKRGISSATVFVDMRAAFYRALPEYVLGHIHSDEARRALFTADTFQVSQAEYDSRIHQTILEQGAPPWLASALADWHRNTFFQVRHLEGHFLLAYGVRPVEAREGPRAATNKQGVGSVSLASVPVGSAPCFVDLAQRK